MKHDAWFAGFADGEGCFEIRRCENGYRYVPRFALGLRADDAPILERLSETFGGRLAYQTERDSPWGRPKGMAPQCKWHVVAKRDLAALVEYFDRFPLRAKKAADYAIWRRAVMVYCASGGRDPQLGVLCAALRGGRAFDADQPDPVDPFEVQMALGIDDGRTAS